MGLPQSLVRLMFFRRSGGGNSSPSCPPNSSSSSGSVAQQQQKTKKKKKKGTQRRSSCFFPCKPMAPRTRSKTKAARGNELELANEEGGCEQQEKPISSRRIRQRVRKNDAASAALDAAKNRGYDMGSEDASECEICKAPTGIDSFVTVCRHTYCRNCLREHVKKVLQLQMSVTQPTFQDLLAQILCPALSCKEELSRSEVVDLVGPKPVNMYERWLVFISDKLYRPSLMKSQIQCTNENCSEQATPTVILASKIPDLTFAEVRHALEVRGIKRNCLKLSCVRGLLKSVGMDERNGNKVVWLCTTCDAAWCTACGSHLPVIISKRDRNKVHRHCQGKQRYEIYKSLAELEDACKVYTQGKQSPPTKGGKAAVAGNTIWADGTGYGGDLTENKNHSENMQAAAKRVELELDNLVEKQLVFLTGVLRGDVGNEHGKSSPLTTATCALLGWENILSRLLQQLAANDSMLDISERSGLYLKMVSLLGAIQLHGELCPLLSGCRKEGKLSDNEAWVGRLVGPEWGTSMGATKEGDDHAVDTSNTLIQKMGNIYRQAKVMLQNMPQSDGNNAADVDMSLARELCKCYESMQEVISKQDVLVADVNQASRGTVSRSKAKKHLESSKEDVRLDLSAIRYKESLSKMQFRQLCMVDENGEYKHTYKNHISGKVENALCIDKRGTHNHKRMIHLSKEIASLATNLPLEWESSIHLCVDESRMDVLRALIIGPQGTPYQNGLFFFDIFLPPDYPQAPPLVHFLTTGGGKVRFNPNLYDSGKICLSLLGTWNGPGWVPGKSTLLQVLVSIQSLIFVKDPYYNEPGFEQTKSPEAEKENSRHREHTLSIAVLGALRKPDPLFADITSEHFRFKQVEMESQCDEWVAATSDGYARQRIANVAKDVKAELQNLCS